MKQFALLMAAAAILLSSCEEIRRKKPETRIPVRVEEVTIGSMGETHSYVGTIAADKAVTLSFETGGALQRICVRAGQKVAKGTLLAELDNRTARNAYEAAKVTLERAEDGYRRAESVYQKGSLPEVKWVEIQTQLNQA
ncbi:MAG: biotin/lipoyl-binding protein, partial [Bacteroidales bacterium]|nr:biotin/lipoyl-binding protein [Bacteroidales bacterium]